MANLDNLLASGEQPLRREHQHWFVVVADACGAGALPDAADYGNTPALTLAFLRHLAQAMPRQLVLL